MNINNKKSLADYLEKNDYMVDGMNVKDDFVLAAFSDINQKLDHLLDNQEKLINNTFTR